MVEAVETMDGWYSLHDLRKIDWTSWKLASKKKEKQQLRNLKICSGSGKLSRKRKMAVM